MKDSRVSSSKLYERLSKASSQFTFWCNSEVEIVKERISQTDVILDLGCGWGRFIKELHPVCNKIIGADCDVKEVREAKQYVGNVENVFYSVQDGAVTSFKNQSFDAVIMMGNIFGNLDNETRQKVLDEAIRVVKENGRILISAYSRNATCFRIEMFKNAGLSAYSADEGKIVIENSWFSEDFHKYDFLQILTRPQLNINLHDIGTIGFVAELSPKKETT